MGPRSSSLGSCGEHIGRTANAPAASLSEDVRVVLLSLPIRLDPRPGELCDFSSEIESGHIVGLNVIAAHDAGDAGHFRGGGECGKGKLDLMLRTVRIRLGEDSGMAFLDETECVTAGEELEHLCARGADRTVAGDIARERRSDESVR